MHSKKNEFWEQGESSRGTNEPHLSRFSNELHKNLNISKNSTADEIAQKYLRNKNMYQSRRKNPEEYIHTHISGAGIEDSLGGTRVDTIGKNISNYVIPEEMNGMGRDRKYSIPSYEESMNSVSHFSNTVQTNRLFQNSGSSSNPIGTSKERIHSKDTMNMPMMDPVSHRTIPESTYPKRNFGTDAMYTTNNATNNATNYDKEYQIKFTNTQGNERAKELNEILNKYTQRNGGENSESFRLSVHKPFLQDAKKERMEFPSSPDLDNSYLNRKNLLRILNESEVGGYEDGSSFQTSMHRMKNPEMKKNVSQEIRKKNSFGQRNKENISFSSKRNSTINYNTNMEYGVKKDLRKKKNTSALTKSERVQSPGNHRMSNRPSRQRQSVQEYVGNRYSISRGADKVVKSKRHSNETDILENISIFNIHNKNKQELTNSTNFVKDRRSVLHAIHSLKNLNLTNMDLSNGVVIGSPGMENSFYEKNKNSSDIHNRILSDISHSSRIIDSPSNLTNHIIRGRNHMVVGGKNSVDNLLNPTVGYSGSGRNIHGGSEVVAERVGVGGYRERGVIEKDHSGGYEEGTNRSGNVTNTNSTYDDSQIEHEMNYRNPLGSMLPIHRRSEYNNVYKTNNNNSNLSNSSSSNRMHEQNQEIMGSLSGESREEEFQQQKQGLHEFVKEKPIEYISEINKKNYMEMNEYLKQIRSDTTKQAKTSAYRYTNYSTKPDESTYNNIQEFHQSYKENTMNNKSARIDVHGDRIFRIEKEKNSMSVFPRDESRTNKIPIQNSSGMSYTVQDYSNYKNSSISNQRNQIEESNNKATLSRVIQPPTSENTMKPESTIWGDLSRIHTYEEYCKYIKAYVTNFPISNKNLNILLALSLYFLNFTINNNTTKEELPDQVLAQLMNSFLYGLNLKTCLLKENKISNNEHKYYYIQIKQNEKSDTSDQNKQNKKYSITKGESQSSEKEEGSSDGVTFFTFYNKRIIYPREVEGGGSISSTNNSTSSSSLYPTNASSVGSRKKKFFFFGEDMKLISIMEIYKIAWCLCVLKKNWVHIDLLRILYNEVEQGSIENHFIFCIIYLFKYCEIISIEECREVLSKQTTLFSIHHQSNENLCMFLHLMKIGSSQDQYYMNRHKKTVDQIIKHFYDEIEDMSIYLCANVLCALANLQVTSKQYPYFFNKLLNYFKTYMNKLNKSVLLVNILWGLSICEVYSVPLLKDLSEAIINILHQIPLVEFITIGCCFSVQKVLVIKNYFDEGGKKKEDLSDEIKNRISKEYEKYEGGIIQELHEQKKLFPSCFYRKPMCQSIVFKMLAQNFLQYDEKKKEVGENGNCDIPMKNNTSRVSRISYLGKEEYDDTTEKKETSRNRSLSIDKEKDIEKKVKNNIMSTQQNRFHSSSVYRGGISIGSSTVGGKARISYNAKEQEGKRLSIRKENNGRKKLKEYYSIYDKNKQCEYVLSSCERILFANLIEDCCNHFDTLTTVSLVDLFFTVGVMELEEKKFIKIIEGKEDMSLFHDAFEKLMKKKRNSQKNSNVSEMIEKEKNDLLILNYIYSRYYDESIRNGMTTIHEIDDKFISLCTHIYSYKYLQDDMYMNIIKSSRCSSTVTTFEKLKNMLQGSSNKEKEKEKEKEQEKEKEKEKENKNEASVETSNINSTKERGGEPRISSLPYEEERYTEKYSESTNMNNIPTTDIPVQNKDTTVSSDVFCPNTYDYSCDYKESCMSSQVKTSENDKSDLYERAYEEYLHKNKESEQSKENVHESSLRNENNTNGQIIANLKKNQECYEKEEEEDILNSNIFNQIITKRNIQKIVETHKKDFAMEKQKTMKKNNKEEKEEKKQNRENVGGVDFVYIFLLSLKFSIFSFLLFVAIFVYTSFK